MTGPPPPEAAPMAETKLRHAEAMKLWRHDQVHWALYCLSGSDMHEITDNPLRGTMQALRHGWATVKREYVDGSFNVRVLSITDAGREELDRASKESADG